MFPKTTSFSNYSKSFHLRLRLHLFLSFCLNNYYGRDDCFYNNRYILNILSWIFSKLRNYDLPGQAILINYILFYHDLNNSDLPLRLSSIDYIWLSFYSILVTSVIFLVTSSSNIKRVNIFICYVFCLC